MAELEFKHVTTVEFGFFSKMYPENLNELSQSVLNNKSDLGVAFDGDGDRSLFCDNKGQILTGDKSALLLSRYILEKKPKLNCSNMFEF